MKAHIGEDLPAASELFTALVHSYCLPSSSSALYSFTESTIATSCIYRVTYPHSQQTAVIRYLHCDCLHLVFRVVFHPAFADLSSLRFYH